MVVTESLDAADYVTIAVYFVLVLGVGLWVSLFLTLFMIVTVLGTRTLT